MKAKTSKCEQSSIFFRYADVDTGFLPMYMQPVVLLTVRHPTSRRSLTPVRWFVNAMMVPRLGVGVIQGSSVKSRSLHHMHSTLTAMPTALIWH